MKSIIIGGGKIGYFLLNTLKDRGHNVILIERDEDICKKLAEEIDADIICGDGTDIDVLRDAGIEEAEIIAAVTGNDEENLVVCEIAKISFSISKSIARVNNPKNIEMFKALGVDDIVCSTEVIANLIEYEFDREEFKIIQTLNRGSMVLAEISIGEDSGWRDCLIKDLELPHECVIASVLRGDTVIYPRGNVQIQKGDNILVITNKTVLRDFKRYLRNGGLHNARQKN